MIEILKAIVFGIVEGITEWLPISSTGHMILLNEFLTLNVSKEFWDMFLVVIQLGAILAVVLLFWKQIWPFGIEGGKPKIHTNIIINWCKIVVACLPAIIFVVLGLDDVCDSYFYNPVCVAIALIVFGVAFILVENRNAGKQAVAASMEDITWKMAALIGVFQLLAAAFPGTSRSGATILGAMLIGVARTPAAEFSFFLSVPVMFGASFLKLIKFGFAFTGPQLFYLLLGMVIAYIVSVYCINFLMRYIRKNSFVIFGYYRIGLGIIVLIWFAISALLH